MKKLFCFCLAVLMLAVCPLSACAAADAEDVLFSKSEYNDVAAEAEGAVLSVSGGGGARDRKRGEDGGRSR